MSMTILYDLDNANYNANQDSHQMSVSLKKYWIEFKYFEI